MYFNPSVYNGMCAMNRESARKSFYGISFQYSTCFGWQLRSHLISVILKQNVIAAMCAPF